MPYHNNLDIGSILREASKRDKKRFQRVIEHCRKNNRKQEDLVAEAYESIRQKDKAKFDRINDSKTPEWERAAILFEHIVSELLISIA